MQTLTRPRPTSSGPSLPPPRRGKRFSPFMLIGAIVTVVVAIAGGAFLVTQARSDSHAAGNAAAVNLNCTLIAPPNPLTAQGLATPWQLTATDPAQGPCNQANKMQTTFVQGAVIDPASGKISIYNPLVIDQDTQPAVAPVVPQLPKNGIVALWGGSNAGTITLKGTQGSLQQGNCVNGLNDSAFGQFWYCNAPAFFAMANQAIQQKKLVVPALGSGKDGMPCLTSRDFGVVDQDQSDNVTSTYLVNGNGQTAQMTMANAALLQGAQTIANGSDERLVAVALDGALGCVPWTAPDLADPGQMVPALPLNELQAAALQAAPMALVPNLDPMVLVNNHRNLQKLNLYRAGVDQPQVNNSAMSSTTAYCQNLRQIGPARMMLDAQFTMGSPSPDPAAATTLATFLAQRFVNSYEKNGLGCMALLKQADPVAIQQDAAGVTISATVNGVALGGGNGGGGGTPGAPNCNVNGTMVQGCAGTTTINGQACTFAFANNTVTVNCTGAAKQVGGPAQQGAMDGVNGKQQGNGSNGANTNATATAGGGN